MIPNTLSPEDNRLIGRLEAVADRLEGIATDHEERLGSLERSRSYLRGVVYAITVPLAGVAAWFGFGKATV